MGPKAFPVHSQCGKNGAHLGADVERKSYPHFPTHIPQLTVEKNRVARLRRAYAVFHITHIGC